MALGSLWAMSLEAQLPERSGSPFTVGPPTPDGAPVSDAMLLTSPLSTNVLKRTSSSDQQEVVAAQPNRRKPQPVPTRSGA